MSGPLTLHEARRRWFRPPRAHGDVREERVVSFVELFYDLIYVVLIAQISHTLAGEVSWEGVGRFATVFVLIWFAWFNGSMYHEIHGGEDGRSRMFIFAQMSVLAVMAVFAPHAGDDAADGRGFAVTYAVLLGVLGIQWVQVRGQDAPDERHVVTRYLAVLAAVCAVVVASVFVDAASTRLWMWVGALGIIALLIVPRLLSNSRPMPVTESMVERFGLFTIIVLGEVIVGVVDGIDESSRSAITIITGLLALQVGFGVWWNYFDFTGRKIPRDDGRVRAVWMFSHLPLTLAIAALGAGLVSFVAHADRSQPSVAESWLVGGSLAGVLIAIALVTSTMKEHPGRRLVPMTLTGAAGASLVLAAARPPAWLFATLALGALSAVWLESFARHARHGELIVEGYGSAHAHDAPDRKPV